MDNEKIRKALDHFENDEFSDAQDILQAEISDRKYEHLNKELELDEKYMGKKEKVTEEDDEDENGNGKKKKKNPFEKKNGNGDE